MRIRILLVLLVTSAVSFSGCAGVTQSEYDDLLEQYNTIQTEKQELQDEYTALQHQCDSKIAQLQDCENRKVRYFTNRLEIEQWLNDVPKLGVSKDVAEWLEYALYYQKRALDAGFITSVSYTINDDASVFLTCDVVTEDGWIYYFDPDDCVLEDTGIRIDIGSVDSLSNRSSLSY